MEAWFIFNLRKININQYFESIHVYGIIMIRTGDILQEFMATSIIMAKNTQLRLCTYLNSHLLWSTSQICPSWPQSRLELSLPMVSFPMYTPCLLWPTQCLAVCSNGSSVTLNLFIAHWVLLTNVQ
jgi:hypothetical protein